VLAWTAVPCKKNRCCPLVAGWLAISTGSKPPPDRVLFWKTLISLTLYANAGIKLPGMGNVSVDGSSVTVNRTGSPDAKLARSEVMEAAAGERARSTTVSSFNSPPAVT
jgi:hypothetical protein